MVWFLANSIKIVKQQYNEREYNLATYNQANYNITGELYAVKPDGTEVVVDAAGKLWEIPDLKITRHDKLLLEVKDNIVINVWVLSYTRPTN